MKNPAGALTKSVAPLKPTPAIDTTTKPNVITPNSSVDRRLPPPELSARRTRKRNQAHLRQPKTT